MTGIHTSLELKTIIQHLEERKAIEWLQLKDELLKTAEAVRPVNLIKNTVVDVLTDNQVKESLLVSAVSLTAGFASKALIVGASTHPLKRLFGTIVQLALTKLISKNPETVRLVGNTLIDLLPDKKEKKPYGDF